MTFIPGSCPPSPGFEPCAILICSSSADRRYAGVTPKRADATCLVRLPSQSEATAEIAESAEKLFSAFPACSAVAFGRMYRSGSSPPSPLLLLAPRRFMAVEIVRCVSGESAPTDIAEAKKRRQIASTDSTCSSGAGVTGVEGVSSTRSRIACGGRP
jgi:hypothetical protein